MRVKELERLTRDFSLGSDCPNSTSTRSGFVEDQQRNYSHLQTRNPLSHAHFDTHRKHNKSSLFSTTHTDRKTLANTHTCAHKDMVSAGERMIEGVTKWLRGQERERVKYIVDMDIIRAG